MPPIWTPEHIVDRKQAERLILEQFPELAPLRLETVGEGYDNTVYRVNEAYAFRFPRRAVGASLLRNECAVLPALAELELPLDIPKLHYAGTPTPDYPWPFAGYSYVRGTPPGSAPASVRALAVRPLARFLHELHRFPVERARALGVPNDTLGRMDLAKRLNQLTSRLEEALQHRLWPDSEPVIAIMDDIRPDKDAIKDRPQSLVHGDLHIRNVVADEQGVLSGVIDWGDVHIGDPALDLSIVYSYVPAEARNEFYGIYGQTDETARRLARFFAVFVGFSLLVYGRDGGDAALVEAARHSILNALQA